MLAGRLGMSFLERFRKISPGYFILASMVVAWVFALVYLSESRWNSSIVTSVSRPVLFKLREYLNKTPKLTSKIKIFALDDKSVSFLQNDELSLKDFTLLMENIAKSKPKAIILDKLFSKSPALEASDEWLMRLRSLDVELYSGSFSSNRSIKYRTPLDFSQLKSPRKFLLKELKKQQDKQQSIAYAFAPSFRGVFKNVGHIGLQEGGTIQPYITDKDNHVIPHLSLLAANTLTFTEESIRVDEMTIPLNYKGEIEINFRPFLNYYKSIKSMKPAIQRARVGEPERFVNEGDVVLVLFNFYTGSTDFYGGSPFGDIPGGLLVATLIDSVIENNWINSLNIQREFIIIFSIVGTILGLVAGVLSFWLILIFLSVTYFVSVVFVFSYFSVMMPWVLPLLSCLVVGLLFYIYKRVSSEITRVELEREYFVEKSLRLEEENKKIKLEEKLNLGRAVQDILLPSEFDFELNDNRILMRYTPAQEMSGDWLYHWKHRDGSSRILIGDVVGKGPSAAIPVAVIIGVLGECEQAQCQVEEIFFRLNRRLIELFDFQISCTCALLEIRHDSLIYVYNAGSPGWFVVAQSSAKYLPMRSSPLGMNQQPQIASQKLELKKGDICVSFTDGYLEGSRAIKKFKKILESQGINNLNELHDMLEVVGEGSRLEDDKTLLAIKCL